MPVQAGPAIAFSLSVEEKKGEKRSKREKIAAVRVLCGDKNGNAYVFELKWK